jgi:hypothetical protein
LRQISLFDADYRKVFIMNKEAQIFRSLVLLGKSIYDLMQAKGHSNAIGSRGKPYVYIINEITEWLHTRYPDKSDFPELLIHETLHYLIRQNLLTDKDDYYSGENDEYYSDIHIINTNENSYGDKYLGTSFRDRGSFGSLPIYDDYSEDSES